MYYFVNKDKYCQIWTCLVWFYFTVLVFAHFCNEIEKFQLYTSLKYLVFYGQWKIMSDLNMSHGKMSDFVLFPLFAFTLIIKLRNFDFEGNWNTSRFFYKKLMSDLIVSCQACLIWFKISCLSRISTIRWATRILNFIKMV